MLGSIAPGVHFLRVWKATELYSGIKPHYGVSLTVDGRSTSRIDGGGYTEAPGTILLKQPGQIQHVLERESPGTFQLVSFDAELMEASRLALDHGLQGRLAAVHVDPRDERVEPLRRLHEVILSGAPDRFAVDVAVAAAVAAFTSFLGATPRATGASFRPNVRRAREFLLEHVAEKVTLDDLADHARTDKFHLCREFSRELGLPPYAFLTRARIARARASCCAKAWRPPRSRRASGSAIRVRCIATSSASWAARRGPMPASAVAGEAGSGRPGEHRAPQVPGELMVRRSWARRST